MWNTSGLDCSTYHISVHRASISASASTSSFVVAIKTAVLPIVSAAVAIFAAICVGIVDRLIP